jgi:DNA-binding NtrC family response regulator
MASILIVGDDFPVVQAQAGRLHSGGHLVEVAQDIFRARDRLSGEPCDLVIIDVRLPDGGMGLLIEQARAAWPGCAVVALVQRADLRHSKVHEMGLWTPDAVLVHPVSTDDLARTVASLGRYHEVGDEPPLREVAV